jgi:hypothetical protein
MGSLPPGLDLSSLPVVPPPPGVTSNFVDPPSISWAPRLAVYLTLPPMLLVACLRLFVRLRNRQIGVDDCKPALLINDCYDPLMTSKMSLHLLL